MSTPEALRLAHWLETEQDPEGTVRYVAGAELRRQHAEIERLTALAGPGGKSLGELEKINDGLIAENERLTAALTEAQAETSIAHLAFEQVKASRAKLRRAIAALLDDDDHDTAKELARAALKGDKP